MTVPRNLVLCAAISWLAGACAPEGAGVAFVSVNVKPDSECTVSPSAEDFIPQGIFDISAGLVDGCMRSYAVHLLVNAYLREGKDMAIGRSEGNVLQLHSAEVKLTTVTDMPLLFVAAEPPLPNPFLVTTNNALFPTSSGEASTGIATVEAIPSAYAPYLMDFDGGMIRATVQIFGRTVSGTDIELLPFTYAIEICDGCLQRCLSKIEKAKSTVEEVQGDGCRIGGVDGRMCIDDEC